MAIRCISVALIAGAALTSCAPTGSDDPRSGEAIENSIGNSVGNSVEDIEGVAGTVAINASAIDNAVIDGNARFIVLTPTLIRLEYEDDLAFQDATTFNAVNRDRPAPPFTTGITADGFREVTTSALTLRYRRGSGPFTPANVSIRVTDPITGAITTAAPAFPSYCAIGSACEAETALLGGRTATAYDHTGFTGSAFIAGFESTGASISHDVSGVPTAGTYRLAVRVR